MPKTYFARMYIASKWREVEYENGAPLSADIVTNCTKTSNNTLSLWKIDDPNDEAQFEEVALAICSGFRRPDSIYLTSITEDELDAVGLELRNTPESGATPLKGFSKKHYDIENLNYDSLGKFSEVLRNSLIINNERRFNWRNVKKQIAKAIEEGRIDQSDMREELVQELRNQNVLPQN